MDVADFGHFYGLNRATIATVTEIIVVASFTASLTVAIRGESSGGGRVGGDHHFVSQFPLALGTA